MSKYSFGRGLAGSSVISSLFTFAEAFASLCSVQANTRKSLFWADDFFLTVVGRQGTWDEKQIGLESAVRLVADGLYCDFYLNRYDPRNRSCIDGDIKESVSQWRKYVKRGTLRPRECCPDAFIAVMWSAGTMVVLHCGNTGISGESLDNTVGFSQESDRIRIDLFLGIPPEARYLFGFYRDLDPRKLELLMQRVFSDAERLQKDPYDILAGYLTILSEKGPSAIGEPRKPAPEPFPVQGDDFPAAASGQVSPGTKKDGSVPAGPRGQSAPNTGGGAPASRSPSYSTQSRVDGPSPAGRQRLQRELDRLLSQKAELEKQLAEAESQLNRFDQQLSMIEEDRQRKAGAWAQYCAYLEGKRESSRRPSDQIPGPEPQNGGRP